MDGSNALNRDFMARATCRFRVSRNRDRAPFHPAVRPGRVRGERTRVAQARQ